MLKVFKSMAKINLDISLTVKLRNKINEYQHYSITKTHSLKKDKEGKGWNKICAIMDRIDDTVAYLNSLDVKEKGNKFDVFEFYNFMNNSATLIDCVNYLAEIYEYNLDSCNFKNNIFNQLGNTGKGTDKDYFEYLRALCSIHPIETSRHKEFQDSKTLVECSPFVSYNEFGFISKQDADLIAVVYVDGEEHSSKYVGIKIKTIFKYVKFRFSLLDILIKHIENYYAKIIDDYANIPLKKLSEFENYCNYIDYIKGVYAERVNTGMDEYFDFYKFVMQMSFPNTINQENLSKYQNAIKYSFTFMHKFLQQLPKEDKFETTGLKRQPKNSARDSLFFELQYGLNCDYRYQHSYAFEKLSLMWLQPRNMDMASCLISEIESFWKKYVCFEKGMSAIEISILLQIAIYFYRLENDKEFSENIPESLDYR